MGRIATGLELGRLLPFGFVAADRDSCLLIEANAIKSVVGLRTHLYPLETPSLARLIETMVRLVPNPKWITFDCYGTLVQWHAALRRAVRAVLADHRETSDWGDVRLTELVDALRTVSMAQQARSPYRDYKSILRSSLNEVMSQRGLSPGPSDGEALLSFLREIPPHPEVPIALARLRKHFRLAIISNTDDDLIAGTVVSLGVPIDFVATAQQAHAYKPDRRLFRHAHAVIGVAPGETVHVGMGQVTDLKVCHEMGIRAVWINRLGETLDPDWTPEAVLPDLVALPDLLETYL